MSMDSCKSCSQFVDTDNEPESYHLTFEDCSEVNLDYCLCVNCREEITDRYLTAKDYNEKGTLIISPDMSEASVKSVLDILTERAMKRYTKQGGI